MPNFVDWFPTPLFDAFNSNALYQVEPSAMQKYSSAPPSPVNISFSLFGKKRKKKFEKGLTEIALRARRASIRHTRSDAILFRVIAIASITGLGDHNPCLAEGGQVEHG